MKYLKFVNNTMWTLNVVQVETHPGSPTQHKGEETNRWVSCELVGFHLMGLHLEIVYCSHCKCEVVTILIFSRVSVSAVLQWQFGLIIV